MTHCPTQIGGSPATSCCSVRHEERERARLASCYLAGNPHPVVSVEYLNPFGYQDFETDKLVCVDVKATDDLGRVFIIEIQIVVQSSFAKRAVFYACEAYADQLRAGQGYSDLKATYSILCSDN